MSAVSPTSTVAEREARVHLQTYARQPITLVAGHGCWVTDDAGREYLDLVAGIAVDVLGHAHPAITEAVSRQAATLVQVSNLYYTLPQLELAEALVARSPFDRVFFTNSGTEANEAAIKLARRHGGARGAHEIVSLTGSFHGRTLGSLAATGQPKYQAPFAPLPPGFRHVAPNDLDALDEAVTDATCAVLLEPIMGEGGIHPLTDEFLVAARAACDRVGALLILDEVQTGMGRTGHLLRLRVDPDRARRGDAREGPGRRDPDRRPARSRRRRRLPGRRPRHDARGQPALVRRGAGDAARASTTRT